MAKKLLLPELARVGVASLKIEGRLKAPEYVANITRVYRKALDDLRMTNDDLRAQPDAARKSEIANRKYSMEMAFSRGLFTGWFGGNDNQKLVHARFGDEYLGGDLGAEVCQRIDRARDLRFDDAELAAFAALRSVPPQQLADARGWPAMAEAWP